LEREIIMKKTYTIQQMAGAPCLTIRGKFLTDEFGLKAGMKLKLVEEDGRLVLLPLEQEE
jgi:hypothetical protein